MPQMQGNEVARVIAADRPGLRVLFMSGYAEPALGASGSLEPGAILLEKPFTEPTVLALVRRGLGGTPGPPASPSTNATPAPPRQLVVWWDHRTVIHVA